MLSAAWAKATTSRLAKLLAIVDNDSFLKLLEYEAVVSIIRQCDKRADSSSSPTEPSSSFVTLTVNAVNACNSADRHGNSFNRRIESANYHPFKK